MTKLRKILSLSSILAVSTALTPTLAIAQSSDSQGRSADVGVDEIIVTAQRREQGVLEVPLSIQAISGDRLLDTGIRQITDLQFTTPGYNTAEGNGYTQIFIRGIGNAIFVGADPSVATFIDDVPRIYGTLVNNFVDVERVEILKGAQGGLYGRNATGGVINIITRKPNTEELGGEFRLAVGEKETVQATAYLNVPISDQVAFALSAERRVHDAYIKNVAPSEPYSAANFPSGSFFGTPQQTAAIFNSRLRNVDSGKEDFWAVGGKLLLQPTDTLKILLAGDLSRKQDNNSNSQFTSTPEYQQAGLAGSFAAVGIPVSLPPGFLLGNPKKFTVALSDPGTSNLRDYGFSGTVTWSLPGVDLTSISAYRNQQTRFDGDLGGASVPFVGAVVEVDKHYHYQEVRAITTFDGPLRLVSGATYLSSSFKGYTGSIFLPPIVDNVPLSRGNSKVKNWSVYAQAEYDVTDNITLTGSGRYVHEKNNSFFPLSGTPYSAKESKFLPAATLSYKFDGGGNAYVRWARGFKSGGINPIADISAFPNPNVGGVFRGETVDTYETGLRAPLFDRRVQFSIAAFYNDYKNLQSTANATPAFGSQILLAIVNAGSARTYGGEASVTWRVVEPLTINAAVGYLNARYKDFKLDDNVALVSFDRSGSRMRNSPEWQFNFGANLDQPVSAGLNLVGSALASYTSNIIWSPSALPGVLPDVTQPSYWIANVRLGVRTADEKLEIAVFANNLFNSRYTVTGSNSALYGNVLNWGNPRIAGIELKSRF